ncbi:MAG: Mpo1-like protein [Vicinamibacterales bacterium]
MLGDRPMSEWIAQYATSHRHPVNRALHTLGIPMIVVSLVLAAAGLVAPGLWLPAALLFAAGWVLQFVGHVVEGKRPEFFSDWRFLFVGLRWWLAKIQGRA